MEDVTLICPLNDLESKTIIDVAGDLGFSDVRVSSQARGGSIDHEPRETFRNLKPNVVIVELPGLATERYLRSLGHKLTIIDHHNYSGLSRYDRRTSLEQFCAFAGHSMTDDLWEIAANDQDFIKGLYGLGLSYERMADVRRREREILGTANLFDAALDHAKGARRRFKDLDLILAPERFRKVMGEAAQWPDRKEYEDTRSAHKCLELPNCMVVFHADGDADTVVQVEYYGEARARPDFESLQHDESFRDFSMWCGGGSESCFWGAIPKHSGANLDRLIDHLLSFTLIEGRPLRHFSTTFLFPFWLKGDRARDRRPAIVGPGAVESSSTDYSMAEKLYFLPCIRALLYREAGDESEEGVRRWVLAAEARGESIRVEIAGGDQAKPPEVASVPITEVSLSRFFNDLHVLSISVSKETPVEYWENRRFWRTLLDPALEKDHWPPTLDQALAFNNLARVVYPAFPEDERERKTSDVTWVHSSPDSNVDSDLRYSQFEQGQTRALSPVINSMIQRFLGEAVEVDLDNVGDERMFVHTCMALAGSPARRRAGEERYNAVFSRATYVDKEGQRHLNGYAYDPDFVRKTLDPVTYRRWYGVSGNLYGFTRFSAVYLGFDKFFHETASRHIRTMYLRMSMMAVFYRHSLLDYSRRVSSISQPRLHTESMDAIEDYLNLLRQVHWGLVRFSNIHWFRELSSQDQAVEIFDLQGRAMELHTEYKSVKDDIDKAFELVEIGVQSKLNKWTSRVGVAALLFAFASIITGYFGLNFDIINEEFAGITWLFWSVTGLVLALIAVLIVVVLRWIRSSIGQKRSASYMEGTRK